MMFLMMFLAESDLGWFDTNSSAWRMMAGLIHLSNAELEYRCLSESLKSTSARRNGLMGLGLKAFRRNSIVKMGGSGEESSSLLEYCSILISAMRFEMWDLSSYRGGRGTWCRFLQALGIHLHEYWWMGLVAESCLAGSWRLDVYHSF